MSSQWCFQYSLKPLTATTTTTDTTTPPSDGNSTETPGYRIGLGLVEISALATLIGATSAEALTCGNKAAAGLPWASMSMFGAVYCAKAAFACLAPDWARETLGLKNGFVDSSLGLNIPIDTRVNAKQRGGAELARGVWTPYHAGSDKELEAEFTKHTTPTAAKSLKSVVVSVNSVSTSSSLSGNVDAYDRENFGQTKSILTTFFNSWNLGQPFRDAHSAYAFDRSTAITLGTIIPSEGNEPMKIHVYYRDQNPAGVVTDWIALSASLVKVVEVFTLYYVGAPKFWWVTAISWTPAFSSAVLLQFCGVGRDECDVGEIDLLAGELPSPIHPGGSGKILLGMPGNIRRSRIWKLHWAVQAVSCIAGMIGVFTNLSAQTHLVIYIWVGFQLIWMVLRVLVFHSSWLAKSGPSQAMVMGRTWDASSLATRRRAIQLVFILANQQVTVHPRGLYSYRDDLLSIPALTKLWHASEWSIDDALPVDPLSCISKSSADVLEKHVFIQIVGVVGDTLLRSAAWMKGLGLPNPDLYDSALVFARVSNDPRIYCVPCARVLHALWPSTADREHFGGIFGARGTSNTGPDTVSWNYWIPLNMGGASAGNNPASNETMHWAEIGGMEIVGKQHRGLIRNWDGLHSHLQAGVLNVSLSQAEEVAEIIGTAKKATRGLQELLLSVQAD